MAKESKRERQKSEHKASKRHEKYHKRHNSNISTPEPRNADDSPSEQTKTTGATTITFTTAAVVPPLLSQPILAPSPISTITHAPTPTSIPTLTPTLAPAPTPFCTITLKLGSQFFTFTPTPASVFVFCCSLICMYAAILIHNHPQAQAVTPSPAMTDSARQSHQLRSNPHLK